MNPTPSTLHFTIAPLHPIELTLNYGVGWLAESMKHPWRLPFSLAPVPLPSTSFSGIKRWASSTWASASLGVSSSLGVISICQRFLWRWLPGIVGGQPGLESEGGLDGCSSSRPTPTFPTGLPHPLLYDDLGVHDASHPDGPERGSLETVSFYVEAPQAILFGIGTARFVSVLGQRRGTRGNISFDGQGHAIISGRRTWGRYYWCEELLHKFAMAMMVQSITFSAFLRVELASLTDASVGSDIHEHLAGLLHSFTGTGGRTRDTRLLRSFIGAFFDWITLQPIDYRASLRCRCVPRFRQYVNVVYDNACNAMVWILNRAPIALLTRFNFFVDRFHWKDHTLCSWFFNATACTALDGVNTQVPVSPTQNPRSSPLHPGP
jgi:hypothetical protein